MRAEIVSPGPKLPALIAARGIEPRFASSNSSRWELALTKYSGSCSDSFVCKFC
jgi:hypothetical protein